MTLHRMVFGQLVKVFCLALLGITGMFMLGGVVQEATQRGLSPSQIGMVIPILIPTTLPYTVPATILFTTCVVYGRLANDNEITALRAAGVHLGRLLAPAVAFAAIISVILIVLEFNFIPQSRQMLQDRVLADADELIYSMLKRNGCIRHPNMQFAVFVRDVRGKQLIEPVFKRRGAEKGTYSLVAHAREAKLWTDATNDKVFIYMPNCAVVGTDELDGHLRDQTFPFDFPLGSLRDTQVRPMNMTWEQLNTKQVELTGEQSKLQEEIVDLQRPNNNPDIREYNGQQRKLREYLQKQSYRFARGIAAEKQMRPALALGGLMFVLVAFPVGVWLHRADYLSAFVSCFLPAVLIYYPMLLAGSNLARDGRVPAVLSVWVADVVTLLVGSWMLKKLFRQ